MSTKQLYEKTSEGMKEVNPLVAIEDIYSKLSDTPLEALVSLYNHVKCEWKGSVADTRRTVPLFLRRSGLFITYNNGTKYITEFFSAGADQITTEGWVKDSNWTPVPDEDYISAGVKPGVGTIGYEQLNDNLKQLFREKVNVTNFPDDEDIASVDNMLKFKDREVDAAKFQSKGYVILRKNLRLVNGVVKNILTQDMINQDNTIYEIRYDFDLNNKTIDIPKNCILKFEGGAFNNGFITNYYTCIYPEIFGAIPNDNFDCTDAINKAAKLAEMTNTTLHFSDGIYKVTKTVDFSAINICGNCATIKGYMTDESPIIHIDPRKGQQWSSFDKRTRIIENLIIDCNSKNNIGIKIYGDQQLFSNIHIIHVGWLGFYLFGGTGIKITNMYIEGDNNSLDYSKGMCLMSNDTEVSSLTIQNVATGVISTGSNQFTNVHTWGYSTRKNMYVHLICTGRVTINNWYFDTAPSGMISNDDNCDWIIIRNDNILKRQYLGGCAILCLSEYNGYVISSNVSFFTGEVQKNHTPKCIFITNKSEHKNKSTILNEVIPEDWKLCVDEDIKNIIKFSKYDKIIPLIGPSNERPSGETYNLKVGQPYYATDLYTMLFWQGHYFIDPLGDIGLHYGNTSRRPDITNAENLYYYDNVLKKLLYGSHGVWRDALGNNPDLATKGTTDTRPTLLNEDEGFEYYDTTLKRKILWNGINWVNLDGTKLA